MYNNKYYGYGNPLGYIRSGLSSLGLQLERPRVGLNRVFNPTTNATPNTVLSRPRRKRAYPAQYVRRGRRVKYIKAACSPEIKFHLVTGSMQIGLTGSYMLNSHGEEHLLDITQGDGPKNRDGSKVTVVGLSFRGSVYMPAQTGTAGNPAALIPPEVRVCIFHDKEPTGLVPTISSDNNGVLDNVSAFSLKNKCHFTRAQFRFLWDKAWANNWRIGSFSGGIFVIDPSVKHLHFYKALKIPVTFDNSTTLGAISTVRNNNLYALIGCSSHIPVFTLTYSFKVTYIDN